MTNLSVSHRPTENDENDSACLTCSAAKFICASPLREIDSRIKLILIIRIIARARETARLFGAVIYLVVVICTIRENSLSRLFGKRVCESPFQHGGFTNTDVHPHVLRITIHYHTLKENIPSRKFGERTRIQPLVSPPVSSWKMGANIALLGIVEYRRRSECLVR